MKASRQVQVTLVRHGFSVGNRDHLMAGSTDVPLTPEGIMELEELSTAEHYPAANRYYASGLSRAQDTLNILFPDSVNNFTVDEGFNEIHFGEWEGIKASEEQNRHFFTTWLSRQDVGIGEHTFDDMTARVVSAVLRAANSVLGEEPAEGEMPGVVAACHAGVIRVANIFWRQWTNDRFYDMTAHNGEGYVFTFEALEPVGEQDTRSVSETGLRILPAGHEYNPVERTWVCLSVEPLFPPRQLDQVFKIDLSSVVPSRSK